MQGAGEFVGFLATPPDLQRSGRGDRVGVIPLAHPGQPFAEIAQRPDGCPCREICDDARQYQECDGGAGHGQKYDPLLEKVGRQVRYKDEVSDPLLSDRHGKRSAGRGGADQLDKPAGHPPRRGLHLDWRMHRSGFVRRAEMNGLGSAKRLDKGVQCRLRVGGGVQRAVERIRHRFGGQLRRLVFIHQVNRREQLQRNTSCEQYRDEHQPERQKQARAK